jgi:selenocysteine lyase/cysteine desulfurase
MSDWAALRREFPALSHWTFLNTATYGQTPRCAVAAMDEHLARRDRTACHDFLDWFDDADQVRARLGALIGCSADDIAFLATASQALSLLIAGIDWMPGDQVITLEHEFPNNQYYPSLLAGRGVEFIETTWESFYDSLTPRTRLAVVSSVNYTTGLRLPLAELACELDRRGILFYVDGTQSVGALRMDVSSFRPAMMAVDAYKWMLTPNGAGFVYVDPIVRMWLKPQVIGWRSHHDWRSVDRLHQGAPEFSSKAERYEGGMLPFPQIYALDAVVRLIADIGAAAIEERVLYLADCCAAMLTDLGATVVAPGSQIVSARLPAVDASLVARTLRERGVLVSARHGLLRVSPHFYNHESEIDRLRNELVAVLH